MANWGEVKTWVLANLGKQNDTEMTALLPPFAEAFQLKVQRDRNYWFLKTISERSIVSTAQTYPLPDGYKGHVLVYIVDSSPDGYSELFPISDTDVIRMYTPVTVASQKGKPVNYNISGESITFWPYPDTTYTIRMTGWKDIDPPVLSSAASFTNSWTSRYPDLYVQELTAMGFDKLQEYEDSDHWMKRAAATMAALRADYVARMLPSEMTLTPMTDVYGTSKAQRGWTWYDLRP
ncbi:MAG: hypothetical protein WC822_02305 [Candidatus Paceibacterota bacterium]|jgi:hypothetical protein